MKECMRLGKRLWLWKVSLVVHVVMRRWSWSCCSSSLGCYCYSCCWQGLCKYYNHYHHRGLICLEFWESEYRCQKRKLVDASWSLERSDPHHDRVIQNFDQNATLYLAVNPEEYIFFKHSCFHCRECFVGSTAFIRVHCTRGGAFISCNVGSLMNEWHWLYLCPLTLFFELPYTFFKSFHMSDCFTEYSGLVNLELKTFHSWWVTD